MGSYCRRWSGIVGILAGCLSSLALAQTSKTIDSVLLDYTVVNRFPHRSTAFTQGLIINQGILVESTGQYGRSSLAKINLEDSTVITERKLPNHLFGEGLTQLNDLLYQLTYRAGRLLVYRADTLEPEGEYRYHGQGWGLTTDGQRLIVSDGSEILRFFNPKDFTELSRLSVIEQGRILKYINELEWVEGEIYANIWLQNRVVIINPQNGVVRAYLDLKDLFAEARSKVASGVLNGIAYDRDTQRLFVTGKYWPTIFEIKIKR